MNFIQKYNLRETKSKICSYFMYFNNSSSTALRPTSPKSTTYWLYYLFRYYRHKCVYYIILLYKYFRPFAPYLFHCAA